MLPICTQVCSHPLRYEQLTNCHIHKVTWLPSFTAINCQPVSPPLGVLHQGSSMIHAGMLTDLVLCRFCASNYSCYQTLHSTAISCPTSTLHSSLPYQLVLTFFRAFLQEVSRALVDGHNWTLMCDSWAAQCSELFILGLTHYKFLHWLLPTSQWSFSDQQSEQ